MRRLIGIDGKPEMPEECQARIESLRQYEAKRRQAEIDQAGCKTCLDGRFVYSNAPIGEPEYGRAVPCPACRDWTWEQREMVQRASRVANTSYTFESFKRVPGTEQAYDGVKALAEGTADYLWVLLYAEKKGCGKTHLLNAAVNLMAERGIAAEYWDVRELADELRRKQREEGLENFMDHLTEIPLLALDELGAERNTPFAAEKIEQIINKRSQGPIALLAATNLTYSDLPEPIASRFSDALLSRRIRIDAPDFRPLKEN